MPRRKLRDTQSDYDGLLAFLDARLESANYRDLVSNAMFPTRYRETHVAAPVFLDSLDLDLNGALELQKELKKLTELLLGCTRYPVVGEAQMIRARFYEMWSAGSGEGDSRRLQRCPSCRKPFSARGRRPQKTCGRARCIERLYCATRRSRRANPHLVRAKRS